MGLTGGEAFDGLSDEQMLAKWADVMRELRRRHVTRSENSPVADWAEKVAARQLGLELVGKSMTAYDGIDTGKLRVQIKGRRITKENPSRQLGAIRDLDKGGFDYLVAVIFGEGMDVREMWKLPIDLVREHARFRKHVNAHILMLQGAVLKDPRAVNLLLQERLPMRSSTSRVERR